MHHKLYLHEVNLYLIATHTVCQKFVTQLLVITIVYIIFNCLSSIPSVQRKLEAFKKEACWASSPQVSVPRTYRSFALMRRKIHPTTRFHALRCRFKSSALRDGVKKKQLKRQRMRTDSSVSGLSGDRQKNRAMYEAASHDDIDDIFATVGL